MTTSVPTQAYLESLVQSIQAGNELDFTKLCELMFGVVDQFCAHLPVPKRRGRPKTYSDSTILKIDMLMHLTGKRGETEILREIKRHYRSVG